MINKKLAIVDSSVENGITEHHLLSIRICSNNISFAVFDSIQKKIVALESWDIIGKNDFTGIRDSFEKIKINSLLLQKEFSKVLIIPGTSIYTLIPSELFLHEEAVKYLEFNHNFNPNEKVCIDNIKNTDIKNIYRLPYEVKAFTEKYFSNYEYIHTSTILINSALSYKNSSPYFLANINLNRADFLLTSENKLKYCNSFTFESNEDLIYYLMNVYRQLQLDSSIVPLTLTGEIEENSSAFSLINKYVRNVTFVKPSDDMYYNPDIAKLSLHNYFILFNSFSCVL